MTIRLSIAISLLLFGCLLGPAAFAAPVKETSPKDHEAIKAEIIDSDPKNFTIDVWSLSNYGVDDEAPTFAIYVASRLPETCADYSNLKLKYEKPDQYLRKFDLSKHNDVIASLEKEKCVIIKNIPNEQPIRESRAQRD